MAPRTISQIAGEFGLSRGATSDPFSRQETAVLSNIQRSLDDIRSQQLESSSARGFGISSFTEGAFARQTADIIGDVGAQFAQARTQEALREADFERGIISEELGADRASRALRERTAAETGLIGVRTGAESDLISARGQQERATLAEQIAGQERLAEIQGAEQRLTQEQRIGGELALTGERGAQERDRKSTRLNSSHSQQSRMPSSA